MQQKKQRRKKLNLPKVFIAVLILGLIIYLIIELITIKTKNIYIINNKNVKDQEIIELAQISDYPTLLFISKKEIKELLKTNPIIKDVKIKKGLDASITLDIIEYKILFYDEITNETILENETKIKQSNIYDLPILINNVPVDIYSSLVKKFIYIEDNVKEKISEIKYCPNDVDDERFLFTMKDGNYVYITLTKIKNINNYDEILPSLEQKKGILYLDSGQYFEILQ